MRELGLLYSLKYSSLTSSLMSNANGRFFRTEDRRHKGHADELNMVSSKKKKLLQRIVKTKPKIPSEESQMI